MSGAGSARLMEQVFTDAGLPAGVYTDLRISNEQAAEVIAELPGTVTIEHVETTAELRDAMVALAPVLALVALAAHPKFVGIGETGLDYFRTQDEAGHAAQQESFRRHIRLARELGTALQIHDRDAHDDVVRILLEEAADGGLPPHVVFHCFSGGPELARTCAEHGWHMSFAGPVTFKANDELREALRIAPAELLLVETDAPFLTPHPHRGRPNAPYLIPLTLRGMAETRGDDVDALARAVSENTARVYGSF